MKRRAFMKLLAAAAALPFVRKFIRGRRGTYPGPVRKLDMAEVCKRGKWAG